MVNTLKIPFMCAEGVGRLRCVEIFLKRARYSALPRERHVGQSWGALHTGSDKSKARKELWKPGSKCMASGSQCLRRRDLC
jgi:hypothetical protein